MHKATTENYTYVHTLALHDALPILKSLLHEIDSLIPQNLQPCLHRRGLGDHLAAADDAEPGGLQAQGVQHVAGLQDHHVGVAAGLQAVAAEEIGRASCRARVCQYGVISGVAASLKNKKNKNDYTINK